MYPFYWNKIFQSLSSRLFTKVLQFKIELCDPQLTQFSANVSWWYIENYYIVESTDDCVTGFCAWSFCILELCFPAWGQQAKHFNLNMKPNEIGPKIIILTGIYCIQDILSQVKIDSNTDTTEILLRRNRDAKKCVWKLIAIDWFHIFLSEGIYFLRRLKER